MDSAVTTGLFTLGVVVVGGSLNVAIQWAAEQQRSKRAVRSAARLLLPELLENRPRIRVALELGRWPSYPFDEARWHDQEERVAVALEAEWKTVHFAYTKISILNDARKLHAMPGS